MPVLYKDIRANKEYYSVVCGDINNIYIVEIDGDKFRYRSIPDKYCLGVRTGFLSDHGVVGCPGDYNNKLNALFENEADAQAYITTDDYQEKLQKHREWCDHNLKLIQRITGQEGE